jgi:hypothetical protein
MGQQQQNTHMQWNVKNNQLGNEKLTQDESSANET